MEFIDLLFFALFLGVWILIFLLKKQPTSRESQEKKGLTLRLLEFIAEYKSSIEDQVKERQSVSPIHMPLSREQRYAPTKAGITLSQRQNQPRPTRKNNVPEKIISVRTNTMTKNRLKIRPRFPKKKMQEAMIWSEILKPPIGLQ